MSPAPYIEVYPFVNAYSPSYPRDMWQVIEHSPIGIVNARTANSKEEAELIKISFQKKQAFNTK